MQQSHRQSGRQNPGNVVCRKLMEKQRAALD